MPVIAIDGPAGAGKSTVARSVALRTGLPYLDTGAMYRCIALVAHRGQHDVNNVALMGEIASSADIVVENGTVLLNGEDVSTEIRLPEIAKIVSIIAAHSSVRDAMREQQRQWVRAHGGGVIEGRDIGTVVFPNADLKIFLTASPEVRAQRRVHQAGGNVEEIAANIAERDRIDSTRADSPLAVAADSHLVDSSNQSIEQVVDEIVSHFDRIRKSINNG